MKEEAMILIPRVRSDYAELLFIRPRGKVFWQFPIAVKEHNQTVKTGIKRSLQESLCLVVSSVSKETVKVFQPQGASVTVLNIYKAEIMNTPIATDYVEEFVWLNEVEAKMRIARMSNIMQDYVLPCLEKEKLWT